MKYLPILLVCWTSAGCMNRAPSLRMLDARARYTSESKDAATLQLMVSPQDGAVPVKSEPQVRKVWIHPFEMETGDYFWGGYMSLVTEGDHWVFHHPEIENPNDLKKPLPPPKTKAPKGATR